MSILGIDIGTSGCKATVVDAVYVLAYHDNYPGGSGGTARLRPSVMLV